MNKKDQSILERVISFTEFARFTIVAVNDKVGSFGGFTGLFQGYLQLYVIHNVGIRFQILSTTLGSV